jgi:glutaredoxin
MNKSQLKTFLADKSSGVVMFMSEFCKTCAKQKEMLSAANVKYISVSCDEDIDHFIEEYKIDVIPHIRIYENGISVWDKEDIISPEDLNFLKSYA